jgi:hypothetical protein
MKPSTKKVTHAGHNPIIAERKIKGGMAGGGGAPRERARATFLAMRRQNFALQETGMTLSLVKPHQENIA